MREGKVQLIKLSVLTCNSERPGLVYVIVTGQGWVDTKDLYWKPSFFIESPRNIDNIHIWKAVELIKTVMGMVKICH